MKTSTAITTEWSAKGCKAVLELLAERGQPLSRSEIVEVLRERLRPSGEALEDPVQRCREMVTQIGWGTTDLRAAGWLDKSGTGVWSITDAGRQALIDHPDAFDLRQTAAAIYRENLPPPPSRRAWLVRGASVLGENLVPTWLGEGFISLAASRFEWLPSGDELRVAAENAYEHLSVFGADREGQRVGRVRAEDK